MVVWVAQERHSDHRHHDEAKSCTYWRFSYFYDIIGGRGGKSYGENLYSRGTGEVQQGGADAHAPVHAGPDGADEREPGKPHRANPGRQPAKVWPAYGKAGSNGGAAVFL